MTAWSDYDNFRVSRICTLSMACFTMQKQLFDTLPLQILGRCRSAIECLYLFEQMKHLSLVPGVIMHTTIP